MKTLKAILSIILFLAVAYIGVDVIKKSRENQQNKIDYAELNNFKYGLFSVDTWKAQLSIVITDEIDKLYLTRKNEQTLKSHLETQLAVLIDKIVERIEKANKDSLKGKIKQSIMDAFVDVEDIKKGVPEYADAIMAEMTTKKTETQIKSMLKARVKSYMEKTFDTNKGTLRDRIIAEAGADSVDDADNIIRKMINRLNHDVVVNVAIMLGLACLMFAVEFFSKTPLPPLQYIVMSLTLIVLLATGVTTPMIDMEAKISNISFVLFDHPIQFDNQVMYFQSKSIMDVFWIMIKHPEAKMKAVGILMVGFSVVFPIVKMLSSVAYYYDIGKSRKSKIIDFFVMKSGKWSMADVMVVAIFMAFVGFNGILNTQLQQLQNYTDELHVITTNGTSLQPGFYVFMTYTILAMFLSGFIKSKSQQKVVE